MASDESASREQQGEEEPRYGFSQLTGAWYRVDEYEDLGDGLIHAKSKTEVDREDVPESWLEATDERPHGPPKGEVGQDGE